MNLKKRKTGELFKAKIERLSIEQFRLIKSDRRFVFDWSKEEGNDVYQIKLIKEEAILGLISLEDIPKELRIFIRLMEVSKENQGTDKEYENVAGCLIAYACMIAFAKDYEGFVSLIPKTELIQHYMNSYGFIKGGAHMYLEGEKCCPFSAGIHESNGQETERTGRGPEYPSYEVEQDHQWKREIELTGSLSPGGTFGRPYPGYFVVETLTKRDRTGDQGRR